MPDAEKKVSRGRPRGAATSDRPAVYIRPAACPRCGCEARTITRTIATRRITGTAPDGRAFSQVVHRLVTCDGCHCPFREIEYSLLPVDAAST